MSTTEIILSVLTIGVLIVACGLGLQNRAIVREVRGMVQHVGTEGAQTREHLTSGVNSLVELQTAEMTALRVWMEDRPKAAAQVLQLAEAAAPKPHACRYRFNSEEMTNGERVQFWVCEAPRCRNVIRRGADDPEPLEAG